ncbi:MAG: hypothetical protein SFU55_11380 [Methylophilus sp.]|nr:hypothetical protein [Methylophilus sp.]
MAIAKLILCASNHRLIAGVWYGTRLHFYETFENNDEGYDAFDLFIKENNNLNVYMIADAIEEEYRVESLPHTTGKARDELIGRKLNQFNRNNLFRTAQFISQDKDKRKDDNYLFVALNNADFLQGWMGVIQANHVPLVGLYLLPMISQYIVQQMKLMAPNILLCEHLSSGLRQTYLSLGRLRMSRLASLTDVKSSQKAYFYLVEIEKTRLYLISQRFITDQTELQLVLPSSDENSQVIGKSISQEQGMECRIVNSLAYAKNVNIAPELVAKLPELLHMQLLANGNIPDNLAPEQLTKSYRLNNVRQGINIATLMVGFLGLFIAGYHFWQATQHVDELARVASETQQQYQRYDAVAKDFPSTPIASAELKTAVEIAKNIQQYNQTPKQLMLILSSALEHVPEIGINRLHWLQTSNTSIDDTEKSIEEINHKNIVSNNGSKTNNHLIQVAFLNAELLNFGGDYRAALFSLNRFVNQLKLNPHVEQVVVLQEPVNVSSLANLQGSTLDENTSERTPAVFKLKIILKPIVEAGQQP